MLFQPILHFHFLPPLLLFCPAPYLPSDSWPLSSSCQTVTFYLLLQLIHQLPLCLASLPRVPLLFVKLHFVNIAEITLYVLFFYFCNFALCAQTILHFSPRAPNFTKPLLSSPCVRVSVCDILFVGGRNAGVPAPTCRHHGTAGGLEQSQQPARRRLSSTPAVRQSTREPRNFLDFQ